MKRTFRLAVASLLAVAFLLAGCGGGGGGGGGGPMGPVLTVNSINPNVFQANVATVFQILGQAFGAGNATVRFTATSGTPFNNGASATLDIVANITSDTQIDGTTTATVIAQDVTATVTVILANNDSDQMPGLVTFNAPAAAVRAFQRFTTIFNDAAIQPAVNQNQTFTLGQDGFVATFGPDLISVGVAALYRPGSAVGWGFFNEAGNSDITFSSPASIVTGFARARGGADATLTAFDVNAQPCGTFQLPNNAFAQFCFTGRIVRVELVNNTAGTDAVVGELTARSFDVATIFNGTQGGLDLDTAAGAPVQFTIGDQPTEASFDGDIVSQVGLNVNGSDNAFGQEGTGTAVIDFPTPMRFVYLLARGSVGASATIRFVDSIGNETDFPLSTIAFEEFTFDGELQQIQIINQFVGTQAVVGLLGAQGNTIFTRFDGVVQGTDFDALAETGPTQFLIGGGEIQATFMGSIFSRGLPNMYVPPSMNAFGVEGNQVASIDLQVPVSEILGLARGSGADVMLPDSDGELVAFDQNAVEIGRVTLSNSGFTPFCFIGQIARLEVRNTVAGALAVIGELGIVTEFPHPP